MSRHTTKSAAAFVTAASLLSLACSETSPPPLGEPGLNKLVFHSQSLGTEMRITVYLPQGYSRSQRYPVLYLLHGHGHTEDNWFSKVETDSKADALMAAGRIAPLIIAAPQYNNSWGINSSATTAIIGGDDVKTNVALGRYEDYLSKDVVAFVDSHFSTIASREGRYVGGQSMGGFAALHLAFRHTDLFSKVGGHMPALYLDLPPNDQLLRYSDPAIRATRDPIFIAERKDLTMLRVYLDCGDQDAYAFDQGTERLYGILEARGVSAEHHLSPGTHSSDYVKSQMDDYLRFYAGLD